MKASKALKKIALRNLCYGCNKHSLPFRGLEPRKQRTMTNYFFFCHPDVIQIQKKNTNVKYVCWNTKPKPQETKLQKTIFPKVNKTTTKKYISIKTWVRIFSTLMPTLWTNNLSRLLQKPKDVEVVSTTISFKPDQREKAHPQPGVFIDGPKASSTGNNTIRGKSQEREGI